MRTFGAHSEPKEEPGVPPYLRKNGVPPRDKLPPPAPHDSKDIRQHMRPGPHPGLRAAAEMQKQQSQGTGRGMMGIVLPMYAVGICVYLVYTLFKVFNKRGKYEESSSKSRYPENESAEWTSDRLGFPQDMKGDPGEVQQFLQRKRQEKELEDLLLKMDDRNVSEGEMQALQKRLEETEAQMTRILQAMQLMQSRMNSAVLNEEDSNIINDNGTVRESSEGSSAVETLGSLVDEQENDLKNEQSLNKTFGDLSPETESYEFVKSQEVDTSTCSIDTEPPSPLEEELAELGKNGAVIEKVILEEPVAEEANTSLRQRKIDKVEED
ncbi:hypothetical protein C0Q70_04922 [Pomacea canaliculata]|uniref:Resistance to inhibitors of cholinesterase protein 3 N-terminal domain-containing protein n=2 Tax=Pomacea canaliculata TaxID=400727 RepID=A0A2T7PJT7_POMCA|nr:hypothetical protein C0Q70_04922 [Pomacea canaliculata]